MSDNPPTEQTEPLDEFCTGLSASVKSPELIAVFRFRELQAGRGHDTPTNYRTRFNNVAAAPTT